MLKRSTTRGRDGEHLVVCDRSGFTVWSGDTVREWNGLRVYKGFAEARHPQDFLRSRREDFRVPDARPARAIEDETFVGPLITTIAEDVAGENNQYAPMGPLGAFALGQLDDDGVDIESNSAGADSITVASLARFQVADRLGIVLDSGDVFSASVEYIIGPRTLQLTLPLPWATSAGNRVFNYTAASRS